MLNISPEIKELSERAVVDAEGVFKEIDRVSEINTEKVLKAFHKYRVSETFFAGTTGYGYNDKGRDALDLIYAEIFKTESALVRIGFVNGTHAITAALFSALAPGDRLISATGLPYDTLQASIGISGNYPGSLRYYGVEYGQIDLTPAGKPDYAAIEAAASDRKVKAVAVQRSRGYSEREALSVSEIGRICDAVHRANPEAAVIVDNCYGEFVEETEPTEAGADLVAGSLIKNPGGGLAPTGGYIAGRARLVEAAAMRLTTPGIGGECGSTLGNSRALYQGLFMAPHTVAQALKTSVFCARLMSLMGFESHPDFQAKRSDIIQMVKLNDPELVKLFCKGIQQGAPIDSFATPEPWDMPGYDCEVIMAAGAFIQGASIELSADAPMRPPYSVFIQGGLTFESGKLGIMRAAELLKNG